MITENHRRDGGCETRAVTRWGYDARICSDVRDIPLSRSRGAGFRSGTYTFLPRTVVGYIARALMDITSPSPVARRAHPPVSGTFPPSAGRPKVRNREGTWKGVVNDPRAFLTRTIPQHSG
jgi:hypothetical protein